MSGCSDASKNNPVPKILNVFVSSINDVTPGPLQVDGTTVASPYGLPFGDNAGIVLKVPVVFLPQSPAPNQVPRGALTYRWIIPSGWRYTDGVGNVTTTSNGSTAVDITNGYQAALGTGTQGGNQIKVFPAPGTGGTISVQAIDNTCSGRTNPSQTVNSISKTFSLTVTRTTPTLTIISDKSPTGGNFTVNCGDQSNYHFRATTGVAPANGFFDNYTFNFSGQLTPAGTQATAAPVVNFTGAVGAVGIDLSARYNRNGASVTVSAASVNVAIQQLPKPVIGSSLPTSPTTGQYPVICSPTALTATLTAGASTYVWTATGGLGVGAAGASTATTTSNQITAYPGSGSGGGIITVQAVSAVSGCASPVSAPLNLVFGLPTDRGSRAFRIRGQRFDYAANGPNNGSLVCPNEHIYLSFAVPSQGIILNSKWAVYRTDVQPAQLVQTQANAGGDTQITVYVGAQPRLVYEVRYRERNDCGWGPITTCRLETMNCDGGEEPYFQAPNQPTAEAAAYPNPASISLTLANLQGPVTLYDSNGRPALRAAGAKGQPTHLDTRTLPAGRYHAVGRDAAGKPLRLPVQVQH